MWLAKRDVIALFNFALKFVITPRRPPGNTMWTSYNGSDGLPRTWNLKYLFHRSFWYIFNCWVFGNQECLCCQCSFRVLCYVSCQSMRHKLHLALMCLNQAHVYVFLLLLCSWCQAMMSSQLLVENHGSHLLSGLTVHAVFVFEILGPLLLLSVSSHIKKSDAPLKTWSVNGVFS